VGGQVTGAGRETPQQERSHAALVFTRSQLESAVSRIGAPEAGVAARLNSPARIEEALQGLIRSIGGTGTVVVRRTPAGLVSPEYWRIQLVDLDAQSSHMILDRLGITERTIDTVPRFTDERRSRS
jgi:hypothetical protein